MKNVKRRLLTLLCLGVILVAVLYPSLPWRAQSLKPVVSKIPTQEIRGLWLTNVGSGVLFIPWGIERAFQQLTQLQFNTLYPVVWNRGHTFYPSDLARQITGRSQDPSLSLAHPGVDILDKMVKLGDRDRIRVIPWFEYGFLAPKGSELVKRHPAWLTYGQDNRQTPSQFHSQNWWDALRANLRDQMTPQNLWLNPFHPEVQQFLLDLIVEMVTRYNVDGIQLDDHFGLPVELGYDPFTIDLYQQEHQGKKPPDNPQNPEWMRWRANKITVFMGQISKAVKASNPAAIISISPNSQGFAYQSYLQDWSTWVERGWVDELVLQVYRQDLERFQSELSKTAVQKARQRIPVAVGILTGLVGQPVPIARIQEQVETARQQEFAGVSFFYWESLWGYITPGSPRDRRRAFQDLFQ